MAWQILFSGFLILLLSLSLCCFLFSSVLDFREQESEFLCAFLAFSLS